MIRVLDDSASPVPLGLVDIVNVAAQFAEFINDPSPRLIGNYNESDVLLVQLSGPLKSLANMGSNHLFFVLAGVLDIEIGGQVVTLERGELFVVPEGAEYKTVARNMAWALVIRPTETPEDLCNGLAPQN